MLALQEFGWVRDADGYVTIVGRIERQNATTGVWETVADFTGERGVWFPELFAALAVEEQDEWLGRHAAEALITYSGLGG